MAKRPGSPRFLSALRAVRAALEDVEAPSAFIGGVAVIARGVPRYTADIDATVLAANLDLDDLVRVLRLRRLHPRIERALEFARAHQVLLLRHGPTGVDLDLSLAWLDFEAEAIRRARPVDYAGVVINAAGAEDLIVYKIIAHRPQDLEDAERLLILHGSKVDVTRVRRILLGLAEALEGPDRVQTLDETVDRWRGLGFSRAPSSKPEGDRTPRRSRRRRRR